MEEEDAFPKVDFTETQNNTILLNISNRDEYSPLKSKHIPTDYKGSFAPNQNQEEEKEYTGYERPHDLMIDMKRHSSIKQTGLS